MRGRVFDIMVVILTLFAVGVSAYLYISNGSIDGYDIPDSLKQFMSVLFGYYFGKKALRSS